MPHVFATCQPGVERLLKAEVARTRADLRPAFGRPGLVTWVCDGEVTPEIELGAVFARVWGQSLGRDGVIPEAAVRHTFARDPEMGPPPEGAPAKVGELVADVIVAPGEPDLIGLHRHRKGRWAVPGGLPDVKVPPEAPSRAYAKIEEAILWAGLDVRAGEVAVEIGSSPGGAAYALVRRGVTVFGADPGAMDPRVLAYEHVSGARVHHLSVKVGALRWEELPKRVDWLLMDVHLAPQVALHAVKRLIPPMAKTLRGAVFTLKMNDDKIAAEIPTLLERVRGLGFDDVRATHLPSNRREICCVAR